MTNPEQIEKRPDAIKSMFGSIAAGYDRANTVLSLGIHKFWKKKLIAMSKIAAGQRVLDCAAGTGDIALIVKQALGDKVQVVAADFCEPMLRLAPRKFAAIASRPSLAVADAMRLPFADGSFDRITIGFGVRNIYDLKQAVREFERMLSPGGLLCILEFGTPIVPGWRQVFRFYSTHVLPLVGGVVGGSRSAYRYLEKSSSTFPSGEEFSRFVRNNSGFSLQNMCALSGGVAFIYILARGTQV